MGRPRKRQSAHHSSQAAAAPATVHDVQGEDQTVSDMATDVEMMDDAGLELQSAPFIDPSLASNTDLSISDMSFLDFLGSDFMFNQPFDTEGLAPAVPIDPTDWNPSLDDIPVDADLEDSGGSTSLTTPSVPSQGASPSDRTLSQLTPSSSLSQNEPAQPSATCSCLADLYLALDSIARLPTQVVPALRAARSAAHAAHNTIRCELCCPPLHKTKKLSASAFQNSMLLGALIPSIADAYHTILELVDAEVTHAIATHTQLTFNLSLYGGIWGTLLPSDGSSVTGSPSGFEMYENKVMDPATWRRSVRSLLKIDVYGVDCGGKTQFRQIGLRDLVAEMEEKSRVRHAEVDALIDAGLPAPIAMSGLPASHSRGKEPHCRHVVQLAKDAVDSLHIA